MPMWPARLRMSRVRKTSRTRPGPLCMWKLWPSAVTMPAASWPRCCSTVMPSYSSWWTGLRATTPTMPHMLTRPVPGGALEGGGRNPGFQRSSWQGHHLALEAGALERGLGGLRGLAGGERPRAQARERAALGIEPLGEVDHAGRGDLVAGLLELRLVAEGAYLDGKALQLGRRRLGGHLSRRRGRIGLHGGHRGHLGHRPGEG